MRNFYIILLVSLGILFGVISCNISEDLGTSKDDSPEACEFEINYAIDKGNYDEAENLLNECGASLNETSRKMLKAAILLGKAGFDIPSIINDILEEETDNDTLSAFIRAVSSRAKGDTLKALNDVLDIYEELLSNKTCETLEDPLLKDVCFLRGVTQVATAGTTFALLFESVGVVGEETEDIEELIDYWVEGGTSNGTCDSRDINGNGVPDTADFSACAMEFAVNGSVTLCNSSSIISSGDFGFSGKTFHVLKLEIYPSQNCTSYDNKTSYKVIEETTSGNFTVITSGYCYIDNGTECDAVNETSKCYPCPLVADETSNETLTQVEMVVDMLNEGTEAITSVVGDEAQAEEIEDQVEDFKKDFCEANPSECACYDDTGTCSQCTSATLATAAEIKIGVCNAITGEVIVTDDTQSLLVDYILGQ